MKIKDLTDAQLDSALISHKQKIEDDPSNDQYSKTYTQLQKEFNLRALENHTVKTVVLEKNVKDEFLADQVPAKPKRRGNLFAKVLLVGVLGLIIFLIIQP